MCYLQHVISLSSLSVLAFPSPASVLSSDKKMLQHNRISSLNRVPSVEYFLASIYLNNTFEKLPFPSEVLSVGVKLVLLHNKSTPCEVQLLISPAKTKHLIFVSVIQMTLH